MDKKLDMPPQPAALHEREAMSYVASTLELQPCPVDAGNPAPSCSANKGGNPGFDNAQALLDSLLDHSPDLIYFKDLECRFVYHSASYAQHFGLPHSLNLKGKTDADIFTPEHARTAQEDELRIIRTGEPLVGKLERETFADGRVRWVLTNKMPWRDKSGVIIGTFGISKDITAFKETEDRLALEHQLLRTLLDNVPDCIYFKDLQSRFVHASRSKVLKVFQRAPGLQARLAQKRGLPGPTDASADTNALAGLTDFDTFSEEHARPAFEDEQEIIRSGKPIIGKLEKETHLDGTVTWCLTTKMPWRDDMGAIIGTFGVSRDITALKKAETELEATHKRLVETSRLAGMAEVATDVLHNVGNALNSINVSCSLALDQLKQFDLSNLAKIPPLLRSNIGQLETFLTSDPKGRHIPEYLTVIVQTFDEHKVFLLRELTQLRNHIDHVNQIVAMQQSYARVAGIEENVEVGQLIEDALQINAAALDRHGVHMTREIVAMPPILVDKHKVLQILVNLIRNAKYALDGQEQKTLLLRAGPKGEDKVQIQVIDNGVGIPAENLTRIFSHGFTTRREGHGFGLHSGALAARDLGGSLSAQSDGPGKGATFTLVLPVKAVRKSK